MKRTDISEGIRHSYDAKFKIMLINYVKRTVKQQENMTLKQKLILDKNDSMAFSAVGLMKLKDTFSLYVLKDRIECKFNVTLVNRFKGQEITRMNSLLLSPLTLASPFARWQIKF